MYSTGISQIRCLRAYDPCKDTAVFCLNVRWRGDALRRRKLARSQSVPKSRRERSLLWLARC